MTELDTILTDEVYEVAQEFGTEWTFYTVSDGTGGSYNANTGVWSAGSLPVGVAASYAYNVTPPANHRREADDGTATAVLRTVLPSKSLNANFEADYLRVGCKVRIDSTSSPQSIWRISVIERLYSGEEVCAYQLELTQQSGN